MANEVTPVEQNLPAVIASDDNASTTATRARHIIHSGVMAMQDAATLAKAVCATDFCPAHFRGKFGDAAVAIMKGAYLGFDPISSLEAIYVISGKPALYSRTMQSVVLTAGHEIWTEAQSADSVTVCGRRHGSERVESSTWDISRAQTAGYTKNARYKTNPQEMLYAKAVAEVARKIAPDALMGLMSAEEMELESAEPSVEPVVTIKRAIKKNDKAESDTGNASQQSPQD
ncbi:hypothetical protein [Arcanobacterium haemolyticum]